MSMNAMSAAERWPAAAVREGMRNVAFALAALAVGFGLLVGMWVL
jgi:hypothetical protein